MRSVRSANSCRLKACRSSASAAGRAATGGLVARMAGELRRRRVQVHPRAPVHAVLLQRAGARGRRPAAAADLHRARPPLPGRRRAARGGWSNRFALARLATEVNAVCQFSADALQAVDGFAGVPVEVIENGIDPDRYDPGADRAAAQARIGLDPGRRYVANVARFHPGQGPGDAGRRVRARRRGAARRGSAAGRRRPVAPGSRSADRRGSA